MQKQKKNRNKGESFIEVLAAILIIGFGVVSLIGATGVARRSFEVGDARTAEIYQEIGTVNQRLHGTEYFPTDCTIVYTDATTGKSGTESKKLLETDNGYAAFK